MNGEDPFTPGTVALVGAGPGAPDLITVRGRRRIEEADVLLHDRLVHPVLLTWRRPGAECIDVGKLPGCHKVPQGLINELLVAEARRGRRVVRLKGGDPFAFGRGSEEAAALAAAGIPFEVVPGVTSAVAVPAHAGIPVTHRGVSTSFTVVTGHGSRTEAPDVDWGALPRSGTLVVLMGLGRLAEIAAALRRAGWAADTPAAVVENGTLRAQRVVAGTLADIAGRAAHLGAPATVVVGDVVRLAPALAWFDPDRIPPGGFAAAPPPFHETPAVV